MKWYSLYRSGGLMEQATEQPRARLFPQVSVYLGDEILKVVDDLAEQEDVSRSRIIRDLVQDQLVARGLMEPAA